MSFSVTAPSSATSPPPLPANAIDSILPVPLAVTATLPKTLQTSAASIEATAELRSLLAAPDTPTAATPAPEPEPASDSIVAPSRAPTLTSPLPMPVANTPVVAPEMLAETWSPIRLSVSDPAMAAVPAAEPAIAAVSMLAVNAAVTSTDLPITVAPSSIVAVVAAGDGVASPGSSGLLSPGSLAIESSDTAPMRLCARAAAPPTVPAPSAAPDSDSIELLSVAPTVTAPFAVTTAAPVIAAPTSPVMVFSVSDTSIATVPAPPPIAPTAPRLPLAIAVTASEPTLALPPVSVDITLLVRVLMAIAAPPAKVPAPSALPAAVVMLPLSSAAMVMAPLSVSLSLVTATVAVLLPLALATDPPTAAVAAPPAAMATLRIDALSVAVTSALPPLTVEFSSSVFAPPGVLSCRLMLLFATAPLTATLPAPFAVPDRLSISPPLVEARVSDPPLPVAMIAPSLMVALAAS